MNKKLEYLIEELEQANGDKLTVLFEVKVAAQESKPMSRAVLAQGELDPQSLTALFAGLLAGVPTEMAIEAFRDAIQAHSRKRSLDAGHEQPGTLH